MFICFGRFLSRASRVTPKDAVSKIKAGANVVQIYTGLIYHGPDLVRDAALAIKNSA